MVEYCGKLDRRDYEIATLTIVICLMTLIKYLIRQPVDELVPDAHK